MPRTDHVQLRQVCLPESLKCLTFGYYFNHPLELHIPESLESLIFGDEFNQSLEGLKFPKLKTLRFGHEFNQSLDSVQLPSLEALTFGHEFHQEIKADLSRLQEISCQGVRVTSRSLQCQKANKKQAENLLSTMILLRSVIFLDFL